MPALTFLTVVEMPALTFFDRGRFGADWIAVRCQCNAARKRTFVPKYRYAFRACFVTYVTERPAD
jgi:hypothetical protein